jgi:TPR repeat protein
MTKTGVAVSALIALSAAAFAQQPPPSPAIDAVRRIDESLAAAGSAAAPDPAAGPLGVHALGAADVSLDAPTSATRLRTPLDTVDIEHRIDKGLTAAGEASRFPPDYAYGAFQRGYFLTAFSLALERAKAGDAAAQTLLGELLSRGLGVKQDLAAAADWYLLASRGDNPEALYALGRMQLEGRGAPQNFAKAADSLQAAADKGHAVAARELGYLLLQGKGREKNAMLGAAYLRRAAGLGDMDAQFALAGLYVEGVGVVADEKQAARWFGEAARNGHIGAAVEYGIMLFNGRGVQKNEAVAARWFAEAAAADNPAAQVRLARLLAEGRGVDKDPAEAARWYLIAKGREVDDPFMEDWLQDLDEEARKAAEDAADRWVRTRREWTEATAHAARAGAAVDNQVE